MKRNTAFLLLAVLLCLLCCACSSGPRPADLLQGTWTHVVTEDADYLWETLTDLDFTEEEIAFADLNGLHYTETISFSDKAYAITDSAEEARANVRAYYAALIQTLYENLDALESVYGEGCAEYFTEPEAFQDYYAYLFDLKDYDAVLDYFTEMTYEFGSFGTETGTFRADAKQIHFTVDGESTAEYVDYLLSGSTLTITYAESNIVVYTKTA